MKKILKGEFKFYFDNWRDFFIPEDEREEYEKNFPSHLVTVGFAKHLKSDSNDRMREVSKISISPNVRLYECYSRIKIILPSRYFVYLHENEYDMLKFNYVDRSYGTLYQAIRGGTKREKASISFYTFTLIGWIHRMKDEARINPPKNTYHV